jgi:hypothetical protein
MPGVSENLGAGAPLDPADLQVLPLGVHAAGLIVRVSGHVSTRHDRRARDARLVEGPHDLGDRAGCDPAAKVGVELQPATRGDVRSGFDTLLGVEFEDAADPAEDRAQGTEHNPPVGGPEGVEWLERRGLVAGTLADHALVEVLHHRPAENLVHRLVLGDVHHLPLPVRCA